MTVNPTFVEGFHSKTQMQPAGDSRGKLRGSTKVIRIYSLTKTNGCKHFMEIHLQYLFLWLYDKVVVVLNTFQ